MRNMKLISFKKAVSLLAVAVLSVSTVSAATISSAVYNTKTDTVTVKGACENILLDSECNGEGSVWVKRNGGKVSSVSESDGSENKVIASTQRTADYDGIKQDVYALLSENGSGKYRISGRVKADNYTGKVTLLDKTTVDNATISNGIVYVKFLGNVITVKDVKENWINFSEAFDVTDISELDSTKSFIEIYTNNSIEALGSDGVTYKVRDIRNIYIDDINLEKLDYTATVAVENSSNESVREEESKEDDEVH